MFKKGDKIINTTDHSIISNYGYDHIKNYLDFTSEPDLSLETIGVIQTIIDIDDVDVTTDFILSNGENYSFEISSPYHLSCELYV